MVKLFAVTADGQFLHTDYNGPQDHTWGTEASTSFQATKSQDRLTDARAKAKDRLDFYTSRMGNPVNAGTWREEALQRDLDYAAEDVRMCSVARVVELVMKEIP